ncbi:unnamed protein product [Spirodela intermedia]|uniref:Uncharacterized protein n=1 Tax=Spirodela intermedia TaxID=51605 RepID=A0A7I8KI92_SPIIN|nr:unnamed protein product [Spirodela intermedia]
MGKEGRLPSSDVCRQLSAILVLLPLVSGKTLLHVLDTNISVSAVFTFGDSTVDSGNNNYIPTATKSNFPPYGRDFPGHQPTGRFCNGRIGADFIAADLGVKDEVPPYLDRSLSVEELTTGVCFGSAGTGFDPLTAKMSAVIPITQQLEYFREYLVRLDFAVGRETRENIVRRAVFIISAGSNDFILNYFGLTIRRHEFSVEDYGRFIRRIQWEFLKELESLGARRIALLGLPPLGCLPMVISLNSDGLHTRRCIPEINAVARDYNANLQLELASRPISAAPAANIVYVDIYNPTMQLLRRPWQFGFEETTKGCCGTGLVELGVLCNPKSVTCPDASKYLFWDSVHPSEKTYALIAVAFRPAFSRLLQEE